MPGQPGVGRRATRAGPPITPMRRWPSADQVRGELPGAGEVRGGDRRDVAAAAVVRGIDHDEREPARAAAGQVLARLRRQDQDGAADVALGGQPRQHLARAGPPHPRSGSPAGRAGPASRRSTRRSGRSSRSAGTGSARTRRRRRASPCRRGARRADPSSSTARSTSSRVSRRHAAVPLSTRETVAIDTPVAAATSRTVARALGICYIALFHAQHSRPPLSTTLTDRSTRRRFLMAVCCSRVSLTTEECDENTGIGVALALAVGALTVPCRPARSARRRQPGRASG